MEKFQYYMLNGSVKVPKELKSQIFNSENEIIYEIDNLSKINFLVGPNNSGKSYLSRELCKCFETNISDVLLEFIEDLFQSFRNEIEKIRQKERYEIEKKRVSSKHLNTSPDYNPDPYVIIEKLVNLEFVNSDDFIDTLSKMKKYVDEWKNFKNHNDLNLSEGSYPEVELISQIFESFLNDEFIKTILKIDRFKIKNIFVSHFRYASNIVSSPDRIESELRRLYKFENNADLYFINGFNFTSIFEKIQKSGIKGDNKLEAFDKFLSSCFFNNKKVKVRYDDNNIQKKPINEIEVLIENEVRNFFELGTGIQMLIILTWPLFEHDSGVIFIEEPELFLHPGIQRKLMEIYATHPKSENFQFFISTHSNHILDYAQYNSELASVFRINKRKEELKDGQKPSFVLDNVSSNDLNILADLGVANSSVFLSNCTIWVEGITDVMYFRTYMKYYFETKKESMMYLENLHFAFVEYGGNLIEHWDFDEIIDNDITKLNAKVISNKIFLIADRDEEGGKLTRKERLQSELDRNFYLLNVREIENTLSVYVVEELLNGKDKATILANEEEYASEKFREYLDEKLPEGKRKYKKMKKTILANECIKIIDKKALELGKITTENLKELLSPSAIELCENIYKFIEESNQN